MELNKVLLIGNLTHDPESRHLPSGAQVCKLRLASNRRFSAGDSGEKKDEVLYIDVETWQRTAEICAQYLRKGSMILVEGRLRLNQYQTQTGENRSKIFIHADRVQFGPKPGGADGGAPRSSNSGAQRAPAASTHSGHDDYPDPSYGDGPTEDDLPF